MIIDTYDPEIINILQLLLKEQYRYDDGLTIIKELIQNANDAFATTIQIIISDGIKLDNNKNISQPLLNHKAILIYNDGPFTNKDKKGIRKIYISEKDATSIGRFGLGLKSIHHLCDMFFYAYFENSNWFLRAINPWAGSGLHADWSNEIDDDICNNFLEKVTKENEIPDKGFFLWIPLKDTKGKGHIIDTDVSLDSPLSTSNNLIKSLCEILPLLMIASGKKLKEIKYKSVSDNFTISLKDSSTNNEKDKSIFSPKLIININGKEEKREKKVSIFKSIYCPPAHKDLIETLQKRNVLNNNFNTSIEIIKTPKENNKSSLKVQYCVYLPLPEPILRTQINNDKFDISILIHCSFSVNSGRTHIEVRKDKPLADKIQANEYEKLSSWDEDSSEEYKMCLWNRFLAQELVYPNIPEALFKTYYKEVLTSDELQEVIKGLYEITRSQNNVESQIINDHVFKNNKGLANCYDSSIKNSSWELIDLEKPIIYIPQAEITAINNIFKSFNTNCTFIAKSDNSKFLLPNYKHIDNINYLKSIIEKWDKNIIEQPEYTEICNKFLSYNKNSINNNEEIIKTIIEKLYGCLSACNFNGILKNKHLSDFFKTINSLSPEQSHNKIIFVGAKTQDKKSSIQEEEWGKIWAKKADFLLVPSSLNKDNNIPPEPLSYAFVNIICSTIESYPSDIQNIIYKDIDKNNDYLNQIVINHPKLEIIRLKDIGTRIDNPYSYNKVKEFSNSGLLFYAPIALNQLLEAYQKLLQKNIYTISKDYKLRDINPLNSDNSGVLTSFSFQLNYQIKINTQIAISNDEKIKENFAKELFKYQIDDSAFNCDDQCNLYRFIISGFNNKIWNSNEPIYRHPYKNGSVWYQIFKRCKREEAIYIPTNYINYADLLENYYTKLRIDSLEDDSCYNVFKEYVNSGNKISFLKETFFRDIKYQKDIIEKIYSKFDKKLYNNLPFQKDISGQYVEKLTDNCFLKDIKLSYPDGFTSKYTIIEKSNNEQLKKIQEEWIKNLTLQDIIKEVLNELCGKDYSAWIIKNIAKINSKSFFEDIQDFKWIPTSNGKFCAMSEIIPDKLFSDETSCFIRETYDLNSIDSLKIESELKPIILSKLLLLIDKENFKKILISKISQKKQYIFDINKADFYEVLKLFSNSQILPLLKLFELLSNDNNRLQLNLFDDIYNQLNKTIVASESLYCSLLSEISQKKSKTQLHIRLFNNILEDFLKHYPTKNILTQNDICFPCADSKWRKAEKIPCCTDKIYLERLNEQTYKILNDKKLINSNLNGDLPDKHYAKISKYDEIKKHFSPWLEKSRTPKLLCLFLYLLKGDFRKFAIDNCQNANWDFFPDLVNLPFNSAEITFNPNISSVTKQSLIPNIFVVISQPDNKIYEKVQLVNTTLQIILYPMELLINDITDDQIQDIIKEIIYKVSIFKDIIREKCEDQFYNYYEEFIKSEQYGIEDTQNLIKDELFTTLKNLNIQNKDFKELYNKKCDLYSYREEKQFEKRNEDYEVHKNKKNKEYTIELYDKLFNKDNGKQNPSLVTEVLKAVKNKIISQEYSSASVLLELFQNADDCVNDILIRTSKVDNKNIRKFIVRYNKGILIVSHFGRRINQEILNSSKCKYDLRNMLSFSSDKKEGDGDTGKFGLGFKSIYTICDNPFIMSGDLSFEIIAGIYPLKKANTQNLNLDKYETRYELTLNHEINDIEEQIFKTFKNNIILFPLFSKQINNIIINNIEYDSITDNIYHFPNDRKISNNRIIIKDTVSKKTICVQHFLLFMNSNDAFENNYKIAFKIDDQNNDNKLDKISDGIVKIWHLTPLFGTEVKNIPFAINAPFHINVGRTKAAFNEADSKMLSEIGIDFGELLVDWIQHKDKSIAKEGEKFLNQILNMMVDTSFSTDLKFRDFAKKAIEIIYNKTNFIPSGWGDKIQVDNKKIIIAIAEDEDEADKLKLFEKIQKIQNFLDVWLNGERSTARPEIEIKKQYIITYKAKIVLPDIIKTSIIKKDIYNLLEEIPQKYLKPKLLYDFINIPGTNANKIINIKSFYLKNKLKDKNKCWVPCTEILLSDDAPDEKALSEEYTKLSPKIKDFLQANPFFEQNKSTYLLIEIRQEKDEKTRLVAKCARLEAENEQLKQANNGTITNNNNSQINSSSKILYESLKDDAFIYDYNSFIPKKTISQLYDEWKRYGEEGRKQKVRAYYETKLLPNCIDINHFMESEEFTKQEWFMLFILAVYQGRPFCNDTKNKIFLNTINDLQDGNLFEQFSNNKPSSNTGLWINTIINFFDKNHFNLTYLDWFDEFAKIVQGSEYSDTYRQIFCKDLKKFTEITEDILLTPDSIPDYSGTGINPAPTLKSSIRKGFSLIIREILRKHEEYRKPELDKFAFMPKSRCIKFILGNNVDLKKEVSSEMLYKRIVKDLGSEEKARFFGYYDIPLILEVKPGEKL